MALNVTVNFTSNAQPHAQPLPLVEEQPPLSFYERMLLRDALLRWRLAVFEARHEAQDDDAAKGTGVRHTAADSAHPASMCVTPFTTQQIVFFFSKGKHMFNSYFCTTIAPTGGTASPLVVGIRNNLLRATPRASAAVQCRATLYASYWLDNRTGVDLLLDDRLSSGTVTRLLLGRTPVAWRGVLAPGQIFDELEMSAGFGSVVLLNRQSELRVRMLHDRAPWSYSSPIPIATAGAKATVAVQPRTPDGEVMPLQRIMEQLEATPVIAGLTVVGQKVTESVEDVALSTGR